MALNKQKVLDSAQKFLSQGKLAQAITEYQTILRYEPKDQVTLAAGWLTGADGR